MSLSDVLKLEADFTTGPLGTPSYVDITEDSIIGGSTSRGRQSVGPDDVYGTGGMSIDRDNTDNGVPLDQWLRGKHIRLASRVADTSIFTGYIDRVTHDQSGAPFTATVNITAVDDRASTRSDLLDNLNIDATIDYGPLGAPALIRASYVPYQVDSLATFNKMELEQALMANECGMRAVSTGGGVTLRNRYSRLDALATFVDAGASVEFDDTTGTTMLARQAGGMLVVSNPEETYRDRVEFTGTTGTLFFAEDPPADYEPVALSRTTECPRDRWMEANCTYLLEPYKSTETYVRQLKVRLWPTANDAIIEQVLELGLGDVTTVQFTPPGAGAPVVSTLFVESIQHDFSADPQVWDCTLGFSNANAWLEAWGTLADYLICDDATQGELDAYKAGP